MKLFKNQRGIAHIAVFIVVALAAIGFVGYVSWNAWQANRKQHETFQPKVANNNDSPQAKYASVESTKCKALFTQATINSGEYDQWQARVEATDTVKQYNIANGDRAYETFLSNVCELSNGDKLVTFSHYDKEFKLAALKGVVHLDSRYEAVFVAKDIPCEERPPRAFSPGTIEMVTAGVAQITCSGFGVVNKVEYNLDEQKFSVAGTIDRGSPP